MLCKGNFQMPQMQPLNQLLILLYIPPAYCGKTDSATHLLLTIFVPQTPKGAFALRNYKQFYIF